MNASSVPEQQLADAEAFLALRLLGLLGGVLRGGPAGSEFAFVGAGAVEAAEQGNCKNQRADQREAVRDVKSALWSHSDHGAFHCVAVNPAAFI